MCIRLVALVLAARIEPASHKLALVQLAEGTNSRTGVVWRSMASIAACVGVSERQAKRIVHELMGEERGLLCVVRNGQGGAPGTVPVYRLDVKRLQELSTANPGTGDAYVTPNAQDGGHAGSEGGHAGSERGDTNVTRTGIGTVREPAEAAAPADEIGGASVENSNSNSRFPEKDKLPAEVRARLGKVANDLRARPRPILRSVA